MNEEKFRQRSLLQERQEKALPKEIEIRALDLLVQLMIAVVAAIEGGCRDEQDQQ